MFGLVIFVKFYGLIIDYGVILDCRKTRIDFFLQAS